MDKAKLKAAFSDIEKQHGPGTVFRLGSSKKLRVEVISTGIFPIDRITGVGGFPRGRIVEVYGPPSGGKTTLTLHVIAEAQKNGGAAAFIDAEHALDPVYAKKLGVDVDNLIVSQPDSGEQALEVAERLIRSEQFDVVVVDSVSALVPKKELEGEMGDAQMGSLARLMSQAMRKLVTTVSKSKTCLIFINQIRYKVGVIYGNPETTSGGEALKFAASMRITVRQTSEKILGEGKDRRGSRNKIRMEKNKVAAPYKECLVDIIYGEGFEAIANLVDGALDIGVLTKSGSRIMFDGLEVANGRERTIEELQDSPILAAKIMVAARKSAFETPVLPTEGDPKPAEAA
jgi:recombination protein RecA